MRGLLRYANYTHVAQGLTERGYPVSPATVSRWAQGRNVTPIVVTLVADLLQIEETAPPEWARRLAQETALSVIEALAPADVRQAAAAMIARLEGTPPPDVDSPHGSGGLGDQAGGIAAFAAYQNLRWLLPIAALIAMPVPGFAHWTMALAAIPLYRDWLRRRAGSSQYPLRYR